jgi:hypothetical protein
MSGKPSPPAPARPRWIKRILFSVLPAVLLFGGLELILSAVGYEYKPRQRLLWKPTIAELISTMETYIPTEFDPPGYHWLRKENIAGMDLHGHRIYRWPVAKRPEVLRVAFLGGSTSEAGGHHPYPERCIKLLNEAAGTERYEGLNVACASYSTHQSLIALDRYVWPRQPDVVVVYHGWNDSAVMDDGFADKEKDGLLRNSNLDEQALDRFKFVRGLRTGMLVGRLIDHFDRAWPRARVSQADFRRNLQSLADQCRSRKVPLVIVTRPRSLIPEEHGVNELTARHYRRWVPDSTNSGAVYYGTHDLYVPIQREVAAANPGVARLADASEYLMEEERKLLPYPRGVDLYVSRVDRGHCTGLGYQKLAEVVAMAVAPEWKERISGYVETGAYWRQLALQFQRVDSPYLCAFAARQAAARDPALQPEMEELAQNAEAQYEFMDMFKQGKWGYGSDLPGEAWAEKLDLLSRCLAMRPGDLGVLVQMFRVGIYTGRLREAAEVMKHFQPRTPQDQYQALQMRFQCYAETRQWQPAYEIAQQILAIAPNDPNAQAFIRYVQQQQQAAPLLQLP